MNSLKKDTFLFICSPSLGIIDSWLPILHKINEIDKNSEIICVFPNTRTVKEIDPHKTLMRLANNLFSKVVFRSSGNHWVMVNNFEEAIDMESRTALERFLKNSAKRFPSNKLFLLPRKLCYLALQVITSQKERGKQFNWNENSKNIKAILFDVYVEKKKAVSKILKYFDDVPKYSLSHGLKVKNINKWSDQKTSLKENVIAYIHSEHEKEFFRDRFGVPEENQRVVGVPRHQPEWIRYLIENEQTNPELPEKDFIFIISRPHTTDYHPRERMQKALQHIKKLAWEDLNKKLVVKLHPKETVTGIYEEVFGKENYGEKWFYSDLHPFVLGNQCIFAIAFYSGVVIDMIAMDVPTIELLDLRELPNYDKEEALRDENGDPVFEYRYNHLTLGANDYNDLKIQAMRILNDREGVMEKLNKSYLEHYRGKENVNLLIAEQILDL